MGGSCRLCDLWRRPCALCALRPALSGGAEPTKDELATKKELEKLQGTWKLVAIEWRGEKIDVAGKVPDSFDVVISGSKMKVDKHDIALDVDPTTEPKLIDLNYTKEKVTAKRSTASMATR